MDHDRSGTSSTTFQGLSASDYVKLINIRTGKVLALLLVSALGLYHAALHLSYGVTPCKGLLEGGVYKGDEWQPWGCMAHKYTKGDVEKCLKARAVTEGRANRVTFLGDSRARQLFDALERLVAEGLDPTDEMIKPQEPDLRFEKSELNLNLEFYRAPYMNESALEIVKSWESLEFAPSLVVIDSATHYIKDFNDSDDAMDLYEDHLVELRKVLEDVNSNYVTKVIWMLQPQVNEQKLHEARKAITANSISRYNAIASNVFSNSSVVTLWTSMASLSLSDVDKFSDGLHLNARPAKQATRILLNYLCNDVMNVRDGNCCKRSDKVTNLQIGFFVCIFGCAFLIILDSSYRRWCHHMSNNRRHGHSLLSSHSRSNSQSVLLQILTTPTSPTSENGSSSNGLEPRAFFMAFARLGVVLAYFYVCDRTNFFMKENKYFTPLNFFLPLLYVTILGLFFNEETKGTRFLNRDQTDEWKGWMQLVILIYHMTGASQVLPIYMHVRVLVSAYIFLSAYGHFFYHWLREDNSLHRFLQVLFRMNFLAIVLCFAMNRNYQAYYFVPLISFWYALQFAVIAIPPKITAKSTELFHIHYLYLVLKIIALISLISIFYMSEYFFEKFFLTRPWKALFVSEDDDISEWWFRWRLDRYSMASGFVFAFLVALGQRFKLFDDSPNGTLWPKATTALVVSLACVLGLLCYLVFALLCHFKEHCNEVHPYVAFIPIISFVLLRNMFGFLRSRYSNFFAWFGRISLELFVAQYHIWLAADTHGVLVLLPNHPAVNTLLTSFIFVCAAHEIHVVTATLTPYFVPKDSKSLVRNLVVFVLVLGPIGLYNGVI